jgi:type VI secretion system protein VasD
LPSVALLLALQSCGGAPPPPPPVLHVTIKAGADQNPEADGKPAPVAVKLYQLTATGAFERADVFALSDHEATTLGQDLLQSEGFDMVPGQTRVVDRRLKPGAQFLGAAVLFRDIDKANWRAMAPLNASGPTTLTLTTGALTVKLQ